jgi:hypothetical protein
MNTHVKALVTLAVLGVLVLLGTTWGWSALTSPLPHSVQQEVCVDTTLQPGDRVSAPKVTVSVFNGSNRVGLAESTLSEFEDQGFGPGEVGNAPKGTQVFYAQVWSRSRHNPAVQLVLSRLGPHARVAAKASLGPGITVVVGQQFTKLVVGKSSVKVTQPTVLCSPPDN